MLKDNQFPSWHIWGELNKLILKQSHIASANAPDHSPADNNDRSKPELIN